MRNLLKMTKTKVFGALALLVLFVPAFGLAGLSPILDTQNLYKIANTSDSPAWGTTAKADPGETLTFMVHVHNGVINTTANNVRVQATLPTGEVTNSTSKATVSADNATAVSGTTSFTLSSLAYVEYIAGSAKLYNHNNQLEKTLPDTITTSGVNIGNIQGCWEYEKWIIFKAKVVEREKPKNPTLFYCNTNTGCSGTNQYKTTDTCTAAIGKPCYKTEAECKGTADKYCPLPTPVPVPTPTPTPTPPQPQAPVDLPVSGPAEAAAGILGTIGLSGASVAWIKSKRRLLNAKRK